MYGGFGYSGDGTRFSGLSDLWELDYKKAVWTKLDKEITPPYKRYYGGQKGMPHPGYRIKPNYWKDQEGYYWLTFGQSTITHNQISVDAYLWRLHPKELVWSYVPLYPKDFAVKAAIIKADAKVGTIMWFPALVNINTQIQDSPTVLILNKLQ